jgi:hypothetical protein
VETGKTLHRICEPAVRHFCFLILPGSSIRQRGDGGSRVVCGWRQADRTAGKSKPETIQTGWTELSGLNQGERGGGFPGFILTILSILSEWFVPIRVVLS